MLAAGITFYKYNFKRLVVYDLTWHEKDSQVFNKWRQNRIRGFMRGAGVCSIRLANFAVYMY
ncbi:MAG: hypothetical protein A2Y07_10930 [Planctomycetes bacterium GWF2_50_10]|nr:MAG: hypothetical protein A2Y07_10930 [Planctomycetes bacterium GWF2_50_10]